MADFRVQLFSPRELRAVALIGLAAVVIGLSAGLYLRGRPAPVVGTHPTARSAPIPARVLGYEFVSPAVGWIAIGSLDGVRLMRTSNGGITWAAAGRQLGLADAVSLRFFDPRHGFAFLFRAGQQASLTAFATDDGGGHWRPLALPGPSGLFGQVVFADAQNGWFEVNGPFSDSSQSGNPVSFPFTLSATHDGGRTWTAVLKVDGEESASSTGLPRSGFKSNLTPTSPTDAWIQVQADAQPSFYFTRDGGRTWAAAAVAMPAGGWRQRANYLAAAVAADADGEVAAGLRICESVNPDQSASPIACDRSLLLRSRDRGHSWSSQALADGESGPDGLSLLDQRHWWMVAAGNLQFSSDGGLSWVYTPVPVSPALRLTSVHFFDPKHGIAGANATSQPLFAGGGARLFHTADGIHWTPIKLPLV